MDATDASVHCEELVIQYFTQPLEFMKKKLAMLDEMMNVEEKPAVTSTTTPSFKERRDEPAPIPESRSTDPFGYLDEPTSAAPPRRVIPHPPISNLALHSSLSLHLKALLTSNHSSILRMHPNAGNTEFSPSIVDIEKHGTIGFRNPKRVLGSSFHVGF
ncbi:hypothetical protein SISNIDRAFT_491876 [Sistotremastrum niveocremeum HHB9708]|uniref:Uncharacterized protein n=1 Tax=Sistotremastrum niveocremeum HHB9708 TaxID=1314777 RepID=A0A164MAQ6_9AGAM|nr:hypothetical protein SISNIDRAFT_491876 [Sistotremastrum niveocremeum HHB9708]